MSGQQLQSQHLAAERVGEHFDITGMREARTRTRAAIAHIAKAVRPGMTEEDATEMARQILKSAGLLRGWHGILLRFGPNTTKSFSEPSQPGTVLQESDIFFVDIGPVWQKWEGDGGDTFVLGDDPALLAIKRDVHVIFDATQEQWRAGGLTGSRLYAFAADMARSMGWRLNLDMAGHRLADFPHSAFHKGTLSAADFTPGANLWVLEIQIRHPQKPFGAFYEDLLLDE